MKLQFGPILIYWCIIFVRLIFFRSGPYLTSRYEADLSLQAVFKASQWCHLRWQCPVSMQMYFRQIIPYNYTPSHLWTGIYSYNLPKFSTGAPIESGQIVIQLLTFILLTVLPQCHFNWKLNLNIHMYGLSWRLSHSLNKMDYNFTVLWWSTLWGVFSWNTNTLSLSLPPSLSLIPSLWLSLSLSLPLSLPLLSLSIPLCRKQYKMKI